MSLSEGARWGGGGGGNILNCEVQVKKRKKSDCLYSVFIILCVSSLFLRSICSHELLKFNICSLTHIKNMYMYFLHYRNVTGVLQ